MNQKHENTGVNKGTLSSYANNFNLMEKLSLSNSTDSSKESTINLLTLT